jgi:hypothetical protein
MKTLFLFLALAGAAFGQDRVSKLPDPPSGVAISSPSASPELDAANKKITELTRQLADITKLANAFVSQLSQCNVERTQLQILGTPAQEDRK